LGRRRTWAATLSWPSRKTSAETGTHSPTEPFGGCPVGVRGRTSVISIRPRGTSTLATTDARNRHPPHASHNWQLGAHWQPRERLAAR
jgi:hypothetical protein